MDTPLTRHATLETSAMPATRLWIKNPLALFTANEQRAPGGW